MKEYGLEVPAEKQKEFEKAVLENYKTVTDYDNQTQTQVAKKLGMSQVQVSRLEKKVLLRMREAI